MKEVTEVPSGQVVGENPVVIIAEQLHPHDGKDEYDDGEDEAEVAQRPHRSTDDADEEVERGPGLGQFEHPKLVKCKQRTHTELKWITGEMGERGREEEREREGREREKGGEKSRGERGVEDLLSLARASLHLSKGLRVP